MQFEIDSVMRSAFYELLGSLLKHTAVYSIRCLLLAGLPSSAVLSHVGGITTILYLCVEWFADNIAHVEQIFSS